MALLLLVEDNKMNQLVALRMLDKIGFSAEVASTGEGAVTMVKARAYDLILMDCQMAGMDGYDTTRMIRELESTAGQAGAPIIGVGARATDRDRQAAIEAGMDDYLTKPLRIADLQGAVERWLGATEIERDTGPTDFAVRID